MGLIFPHISFLFSSLPALSHSADCSGPSGTVVCQSDIDLKGRGGESAREIEGILYVRSCVCACMWLRETEWFSGISLLYSLNWAVVQQMGGGGGKAIVAQRDGAGELTPAEWCVCV